MFMAAAIAVLRDESTNSGELSAQLTPKSTCIVAHVHLFSLPSTSPHYQISNRKLLSNGSNTKHTHLTSDLQILFIFGKSNGHSINKQQASGQSCTSAACKKGVSYASGPSLSKTLVFFAPFQPSWTSIITAWLAEDTPSFDYGGFVVGEQESEAFLFGKQDVCAFSLLSLRDPLRSNLIRTPG